MNPPPDLSKVDNRQLQDLATLATNEQMEDANNDYLLASRLARALHPEVFAELNKRAFREPDAVSATLSNEERAAILDLATDTAGLYNTGSQPASYDELNQIWKKLSAAPLRPLTSSPSR